MKRLGTEQKLKIPAVLILHGHRGIFIVVADPITTVNIAKSINANVM